MRQNKKGFTIVELVVVIAVISILAAVLIPTFSSIVKKSKMSADQQAVRQMNLILATESVDKEIDSIEDVREVLAESGLNADNYVPLTAGTAFVWDKQTNKVIQVKVIGEGENIIYKNTSNANQTFTKDQVEPLLKPEWSDPNRLDWADRPQATILQGNNSGKLLKDGDLSFVTNENTVNLFSFTTTHDLNGENANDPEMVAQKEKYGDWIADFAIILNDDLAEGSAGICGSYFGIPWVAMDVPAGATEGTIYYLMSQGFGGQFIITYETLLTACQTQSDGTREYFNCGTYNLSEENLGKSITVELRLYENNEVNENGERTARYVVCNSTTVEFACIAQ